MGEGRVQRVGEGLRVTLRVRVMLTVPGLVREAQEDWEGDLVMVLVMEGDRETVGEMEEVMVAVRQRVTLRVCEAVTDVVEKSEPEVVGERMVPCPVPDTVTVLDLEREAVPHTVGLPVEERHLLGVEDTLNVPLSEYDRLPARVAESVALEGEEDTELLGVAERGVTSEDSVGVPLPDPDQVPVEHMLKEGEGVLLKHREKLAVPL